MKAEFRLTMLFILLTNLIFAQPAPFQVVMKPVTIDGLYGLQSYAIGQADGKWLLVGGRIDGLHRRQPFGSFSVDGKNTRLIVIDPVNKKKWYAPLNSLSADLQDQLSATNMQFYQDGCYLYVTGGYGYSDVLKQFTTFAKLTAINVPGAIHTIISNQPIQENFRQISDTIFQVTGGQLKKINDTYYLIGGQKFIGRYNPMGPDHGPGFFQQYTDQLRKFRISDDGKAITLTDYVVITDGIAFHRRDLNISPQMFTGKKEGLAVFSGVFQPTVNIPFLNAISVDDTSYSVNHLFAQYYNHYQCPVLPLYSESKKEMHHVFFGGIAQYFDSEGFLVQNNEVPFVKTISRITRNEFGKLAEYRLPVNMPDLLGAGAEFIMQPDVPHFKNNVIKLDGLEKDTVLVGYIFGGILSTMPNLFFYNTGEESHASTGLFEIYIVKGSSLLPDELNHQSNNGLQLQIFPDLDESRLIINFSLENRTAVSLQITDEKGGILHRSILKDLKTGQQSVFQAIKSMKAGQTFWVTLRTSTAQSIQKVMIEP